MRTFGPGPRDFNSASEICDESIKAAMENLLAEKDIRIAELLARINQLEIQVNKTSTTPNVSPSNDAGISLAAAVNQTATSLNQPNQLQSLPPDDAESSLSGSYQFQVDLENKREIPAVNPSSIATLSGPSLSATNQTSIDLPGISLTSWSCVTRSDMLPENCGEESDSHLDYIEEIEETYESPTSDDEDDYEPEVHSFGTRRGEPENDHYAVGYRGVSCVVGGNIVKTFDDEASCSGKLKLLATIPGLSTPDGKRALFPSKLMLHRQDSNMIVQDKYNPNSLYNVDMEYGKVVDEWKISPEKLVDFCPGQKFNQMLPDSIFVGVSPNYLCTIDPRLPDYKGVAGKRYSPSTRTDFSCVVTTEFGWIAAGSKNGDIRLYDSSNNIAKTHLRGCNGSVLALDVSKDGAYLVATYAKHLVLYDCHMGFSSSIANSVNASGIMVNLDPGKLKHLQNEGVLLVYKPAKFNLGPKATEQVIVTSIGPYLIVFNLHSILAGKPTFDVRRYQENVVTDNFRWDNDKDIVVTMPSDVFVQKRAKLSRPNRHSM
ncbi:hypothetical protein PtA15_4A136 [Puccinia triticina]|uniref:Vacuolar import/degradation Vid27 C-terminal domain-containing protein n=1 Tax=Puccinia triticina TaxID=208348 RepID=A0ABY7CFL4_9BASI|nr:uncharacterized protein PtA15_4A136 [Puccinia triticina]WAQ83688.1 hypothetical protein PtA15_4A136 [Puccinia triticina]